MGDFPWEVIKAETLRLIARDLGIKRSLKRDETIAFLRSVQKRGLGPALVNEISKDLGRSTSRQDDEDDTSSPAPPTPPSPPSTRTRPKPRTSASRRTTSRKRPAQEMEPSSLADNEDEDEDAEGEIDVEMDIEPASISAIGRNARPRSNKRLRLSDPGPAPARNTRSKGASQTSVSAMTLRSSPRRGSSARRTVHTHDQRHASKKRTSRKSRKQAPVEEEAEEGEGGEDADADADAEGEEDIESEEEIEKIPTGPDALAAVLTRASIQSKTPRSRGRPRKGSQKQNRISKPKPSRARPQPSVTSQPQSGPSTDINVDSPRSKRTIKPTFKVSLLGQLKRPTSILSRPVRSPGGQALQRGGVILSRVRFGVDGMSEGPKEVFDGVVLNKRTIRGADRGLINGVVDNRNRGLQLDEFVANGIERQNALENRNDDRMVTSDPVLDREDVSTLGGSNKENDFSFRDLSESSDGRVERAITGEEDAEGEWEHDVPLAVDPSALTQDLSQLQHQTDQLNLNDVQRAPFHEVAQPEPPQSQLPQSQPPQVVPVVPHFEPQSFVPEPQPQPQFQPLAVAPLPVEPQAGPSGLQTEPQTATETAPSDLEHVTQSIT